ncbi:uncharacterized protein EV154DRAFT_508048 [Mucor mucedo]|uniref:uncharacterized protein n=1 Tax=Mucor mucedo TaxID=29922 RepID=UPI00221F0638|nr:uncharacterized protein EV154DRAFT_508048 [Mucor mucedo]KAI7891383.1 hypothetical protein EV154DRAFT_508048 [Mucor mucedo]
MARKSPCQHCKQRRRKCERSSESEPCQRCVKMRKTCVAQDETFENESSDEDPFLECKNNVELEIISQQVKDLESELEHLEISLNQQRALVKKAEPSWDIRCVDGQFRLESQIKTVEELMMYGTAAMRYLSPFGKTFGKTSLKFQRLNPSFIKSAMKMVSHFEFGGNNGKISAAVISQSFSTELFQFIQPRIFLDGLVDLFFKCFNTTFPMVHEPSFREHFRRLKDPMDDAITLAICSQAAVSTCEHSFFDSQEKRCVGEFFYQRAMDRLLEMFDDPDKALESLIVINLLQFFMTVTLRVSDSQKWATIASLLASHLQQEYPECLSVDTSLPLHTRTKYATIQRNTAVADGILAFLDLVTRNRGDDFICIKGQFDILPDEPKAARGLLDAMNHTILLMHHPASLIVVKQARKMALGETAELNFEEIIRFEGVVVDWWHNLPSHLKMCLEPYNCTAELIEKTDELPKLMTMCFLYALTLGVHECLIEPTYKVGLENVNGTVRDRAIYLSMESTSMLLLLSRKIALLDSICYSPANLLIRSIDSLMVIIDIKDEQLAKRAKTRLVEYMGVLKKSILNDHQVSLAVSPYFNRYASADSNATSLPELYKNYPLPASAFIFDIINSTINENIGDVETYLQST